jgi:hypothetical protein
MTVKHWAIVLVIVFAFTAMAAITFLQLYLDVLDLSLDTIIIERDQFVRLTRRGLALIVLLPTLVGIAMKTLLELEKEPHKYPPIKED